METHDNAQALGSFVEKWVAAEPELGVAINFLPPSQRASAAAFACLSRELAHATFAIREGDVASAKLGWWHEELLRLGQGESRHPLTQTLAVQFDASSFSAASWQHLIASALQQRERDPASDFESQIAGFEQFFTPLAQIESTLFGNLNVSATARVTALSHALREVAGMARVLENGHLALPLDALARHRLRRQQLGSDSAERRRAAAEQSKNIAFAFDEPKNDGARISLITNASQIADRKRARIATRAADPVAEIVRQLPKLAMATTWQIWRAARAASVKN